MSTCNPEDITVVSTCYGAYWEKFSDAWIDSIRSLDPAPADVILVTDVPRSIEGVRNIVIGSAHMADYVNTGTEATSTEWVAHSAFDDILFPDAMTPFTTEADAYGYPLVMTGLMRGGFGYGGGFDAILQVSHNPMLGGCWHRRQLLIDIPFRRMGWLDWAHYAEMRYFGRTYEPGEKARAFMVRHEQAHSIANTPEFQGEIDTFKNQLLAGQIEMGKA